MVKQPFAIERFSYGLTQRIGTPVSLVIHTIFFIGMFILPFFGVDFQQMLLILTTLVSLEAIYLALFIQMTVNKTSVHIETVAEDVEDIEENIDELQEGDKEDDKHEKHVKASLNSIEIQLQSIQKDLQSLKKKGLIE